MSQYTIWSLFCTLTFIHLYANMQCMKMITIPTLNTLRLNMIALPFLQFNTCPTPDWVAKHEPLIPLYHKYRPTIPISMGVPVEQMLNSNLYVDSNQTYIMQISQRHIQIAFSSNCSQIDRAKAYFHALMLSNATMDTQQNQNQNQIQNIQNTILEQLPSKWNNFQKCAQTKGWDLTNMNLSYQNYEYKIIKS